MTAAIVAAMEAVENTLTSVCEGATNLEMKEHLVEAAVQLSVTLDAVRESGGVVCVLSRESVEALHDTRWACLCSSTRRVSMEPDSALGRLMTALDRDLVDELKETP